MSPESSTPTAIRRCAAESPSKLYTPLTSRGKMYVGHAQRFHDLYFDRSLSDLVTVPEIANVHHRKTV